MAWPITPVLANNFVGKNGSLPSLLVWGTDSIYSGVIVKSHRSTPMVEEVKIENGSGITVTQIILYDGDEMELTVVDDRAISWPLTGTPVSLYNPQPNGTGGTLELFQVIYNNYNVARKSEGERTLLVKKYNLVPPVQM